MRHLAWIFVSLLGAFALGVIASARGESVSSAWFLVAAACIYLAINLCLAGIGRYLEHRMTV